MSSGLPINTFNQAAEYRKRYLATLALTAQNDAYNLQANQVYRQTGQPSRPPDTRTTTEKLGDLERMKVDLRAGLRDITDGTQANETIENLTPDEILFTTQQLPAIVADLKPRFAKGVPAQALLAYIRALRRKFLATNGVSFTAQEATAQQILNAIQAGININNAPGGPFAIGQGQRINPNVPSENLGGEQQMEQDQEQQRQSDRARQIEANIRRRAEEFLASGNAPLSSLPTEVQYMVNIIRAERGQGQATNEAFILGKFKKDAFWKGVASVWSPYLDDWEAYPLPGAFGPDYPDLKSIQLEYLKNWARAQAPEIQSKFEKNWNSKRLVSTLKEALIPGLIYKLAYFPKEGEDVFTDDNNITEELINNDILPPTMGRQVTESSALTDIESLQSSVPQGKGLMAVRRPREPASRYPRGREILGYGLKIPKPSKKPIQIDITKGLSYVPEASFVPFGKYIVNPNKLSSGIFEIKTMKGGYINKYPTRKLSPKLSKTLNRIIGGRMPDEYDFNEMDLEDQNFLYNLAKDAKIMDRINIPTPKLTKDGEEANRFEILKGQIMAGNDNKELVKEFKQTLVKFSNDGRIKKTEAREILLDLAALGY